MVIKKHKLLTLFTGTIAGSALLASTTAIILSQTRAKLASKRRVEKNEKVVDASNFIIKDNACYGLKPNVKVSELITDGVFVFPDVIHSIEASAFSGVFTENACGSNNISIKFPQSVNLTIGKSAFARCTGIGKVEVYSDEEHNDVDPSAWKLQNIDDSSFKDCTNLTEITIPQACTSIGKSAFRGCKHLSQITLAGQTDILKNIGSAAFKNAGNEVVEAKLIVDDKMPIMAASANASNLATQEIGGLNFYGDSPTWRVVGASSLEEPKTIAHPVPTVLLNIATTGAGENEVVTLSGGIKSGKLENYDSLYIPDNVNVISTGSFSNQIQFKRLEWAEHSACYKICANAFYGCTGLGDSEYDPNSKLTLPADLTSVGKDAFFGCSNYKKLDFSNIHWTTSSKSLNIAKGAFSGWSKLEEGQYSSAITYPVMEGIPTEQETAKKMTVGTLLSSFNGNLDETWFDPAYAPDPNPTESTNLLSITTDEYGNQYIEMNWDGIPVTSGSIDFNFGDGGESQIQIIPDNFSFDPSTGDNYLNSTNIYSVSFGTQTTTIGSNALRNARNVQTVTVPDTVTNIGDSAFQGMESLLGFIFPANLKWLGNYSFKGCSKLSYLNFNKLSWEQLSGLLSDGLGTGIFQGVPQTGTLIWPDVPEGINPEEVQEGKNKLISCLKAAGLPDGWFDEQGGDDPDTPVVETGDSIPVSFTVGDTTYPILVINDQNELVSINWTNFQTYYNSDDGAHHEECKMLCIPNSVTKICDNFWTAGGAAPEEANNIQTLTFKDNCACTEIGKNAFEGCTNFKGNLNLNFLGSNITTIGDSAFKGCTGFNDILTLSSKTLTIGASAFEDCSNIKRANFGPITKEQAVIMRAASEHPIGNKAFNNFKSDVFTILSSSINADTETKNWFTTELTSTDYGCLPADSFATDIITYQSTVDAFTLEQFAENGYGLAYNDETKLDLFDYYISVINNGDEGKKVFANDICMTAKNNILSICASVGFPIDIFNTSVKISDVEINGDRVSFTLEGFADIDGTKQQKLSNMGVGFEFKTKFENLQLINFKTDGTDKNRIDYTISNLLSVANFQLWGDEQTRIISEYDRGYAYLSSTKDIESVMNTWNINEGEATGSAFDYINNNFDYENIYYGTQGEQLNEASKAIFKAAPSLMTLLFLICDPVDPVEAFFSGQWEAFNPFVEPIQISESEYAYRSLIGENNYLNMNSEYFTNAPLSSYGYGNTSIPSCSEGGEGEWFESWYMGVNMANFNIKLDSTYTPDKQTLTEHYFEYIHNHIDNETYGGTAPELTADFIEGIGKTIKKLAQGSTTYDSWTDDYIVATVYNINTDSKYVSLYLNMKNRFTAGEYTGDYDKHYEGYDQGFTTMDTFGWTGSEIKLDLEFKEIIEETVAGQENPNRYAVWTIASQSGTQRESNNKVMAKQYFRQYSYDKTKGDYIYAPGSIQIDDNWHGWTWEGIRDQLLGSEAIGLYDYDTIVEKCKSTLPVLWYNNLIQVRDAGKGLYEVDLVLPSNILTNSVAKE